MPAVLRVEPDAEYRQQAAQCLGSHDLADFRRSPLLYHEKKTGVIPPADSSAFAFGRAAHVLILEGEDRFADEFTVSAGPINRNTGKPFWKSSNAYRAWYAKQTKPVVSPEEHQQLLAMRNAVMRHPDYDVLLGEGQAEGVVRREMCGRLCQSRMDFYTDEGRLVDLKTCRDIDQFEADCTKWGYVYQMAFYRRMLLEELGSEAEVYFVAVEKQPPYRAGMWDVPSGLLDDAWEVNEAAIYRLIKCEQRDTWPTGYEKMRTVRRL